jgi:hypothetical protein
LAPFRSAGRKVRQRSRWAVLAALLFAAVSSRAEAVCTGCSNASFRGGARTFPIDGYGNSSIAVADFDRDGIPDVATPYVDTLYTPELAVLRGTPTGALAPATSFSLDGGYFSYSAVVAADFDGDAKPDVLAALGTNSLRYLRGNGNGTFQSALTIGSSEFVYLLESGDFNGDGNRDIAFATDPNGSSTLYIRLGNGSGGFGSSTSIPVGNGLRDITVADFNRDGIDDVVVANGYLDSISVVSGSANGLFGPARNFEVGNSPSGVAAGDWDNDGKPDLAVANFAHVVTILRGTGTGDFDSPVFLGGVNQSTGDVVAGDFNGDGDADLVIGSYPNLLYFFAGTGLGVFAPAVAAGGAGPIVPADFNRDGITDLATTAGRDVSILLGSPSGKFFEVFALNGGFSVNGTIKPVVGDFDGDGRLDAVAGDGYSFTAVWNDPSGFVQGAQIPTNLEVPGAAADFNRDGRTDLAMTTRFQSPDRVVLYVAMEDRSFNRAGVFDVGNGPIALAAPDLNKDGKADLVVVNSSSSSISILLGDGSGNFASQVQYAVGSSPYWLAVDDFNVDTKPDVAVLRSDGTIVILLGDGGGGFTSISTLSGTPNPTALAVGEFHGDGKPDLVTLNTAGQVLTIYPGNGLGGFGAPSNRAISEFGTSLAVADVNADGDADVIIGSGNTFAAGGVATYLGDGMGGLSPSVRFFTGYGLANVVTSDFEADGLADLVTGMNDGPGSILFLRNTNCSARRLGLTVDVPSCTAPGVAFAPQPVARVYDDGENLLTCDAGLVSASILPGTGTPGAVLGGTTSVNASGGIATFGSLSVNVAGSGYRLKFVHALAGTTLSRSFSQGLTVVVSGPAAVCSNGTHEYDAGAGYETYQWMLDGNPISRARKVTLSGLSAGPHMLAVTVTRDGCMVSTSRSINSTSSPSAVVTGPTEVCPYKTGNMASVPDAGVGATYAWTVSNGVITSGAGTRQITFTVGPSGVAVLSVTVTNAGECVAGGGKTVLVNAGMACPGPVGFFTVTPCRVIDTRLTAGPYGGPTLSPLATRTVVVAGQCGIPGTARSVVINVIVTNPVALGHLT